MVAPVEERAPAPPRRAISIKRQTTLIIVVCVVLILLAGQLVANDLMSSRLVARFDEALLAKARALVTLTKFDGREVELDFADEFMPEFEAPVDPWYFELFLDTEELLERSRSFDGHPPSLFSSPDAPVVFADVRLPDGRAGRQVVIDFIPQIEDKQLRARYPDWARQHAILRVSHERVSLDETLRDLRTLLGVIGAVVVGAVAVSVVLAMRIGLRPLDAMGREIARIDADSIDQRLDAARQPPELEPIAAQFNAVLARLENAFRRERQFSSDAAHELRTPVAEMRALAEVGVKWPDDADVRGFFIDIAEAALHLDTIVASLLHLCRGDSGRVEVIISEVDSGELLDAVWLQLKAVAERRNITLRCGAGAPVLSDRNWLELILLNVLNNAVTYSPDGAQILCTSTRQGDHCTVAITNPSEGLSDADLEHVFDRFWRKDAARGDSRHVGIGLSLVKTYAQILGLKVRAEIVEGGAFRISLSGLRLAN